MDPVLKPVLRAFSRNLEEIHTGPSEHQTGEKLAAVHPAHRAAIWFCYVLMTYIPFTAFDLHTEYGLGLREALVITVVSSLGIALPSPGGIGTYHWFVSRSMLLLFAVPEALGVAYAIVTHLVMMIIILVATPLLLAVNKAGWHLKLRNRHGHKQNRAQKNNSSSTDVPMDSTVYILFPFPIFFY
jgi:hypothetical protein